MRVAVAVCFASIYNRYVLELCAIPRCREEMNPREKPQTPEDDQSLHRAEKEEKKPLTLTEDRREPDLSLTRLEV